MVPLAAHNAEAIVVTLLEAPVKLALLILLESRAMRVDSLASGELKIEVSLPAIARA
jgi:hypothetical protein